MNCSKLKMADYNKLGVVQNVKEIIIDFGEICRFCLAETNSNISVHNKCVTDDSLDLEVLTIYNFVTKMTSIKMEGAENFPSLVCENCYEMIKACFNFSLVCQQSDNSLRNSYKKTLLDIKSKLIGEDAPIKEENMEVLVEPFLLQEPHSNQVTSKDIQNKSKWKPISRQKSPITVKADNIKLKYQKMNSLSERLKEAQLKLAEDILRSNDMMLGLPKCEELKEAVSGLKSSYVCPQCTLSFRSPDALKFHYLAVHGQIRKFKSILKYQCKKCIKSFSEQSKLIKHYKLVHDISESNLLEEDVNYKVRKSIRGRRKFYCLHCLPYKIFVSRQQLVEHLKESHNMTDSPADFSCGQTETNRNSSSKMPLIQHLQTEQKDKVQLDDKNASNLKLFKVYVRMDYSPPVSLSNLNASMQHKMDIPDKQMENIPKQEFSTIYVDSLDVFKDSKQENTNVSFKMLCKNCEPSVEFASTSEFVNHMYTQHNDSMLDNWDIASEEKDDNKKNTQWKCSECSATYFRKQSLCYHMKEKHNLKTNLGAMKCPEPGCSESFFTNRQLIQHGISTHQKYFANFHEIYKTKILQCSEEDNRIKNFECDICLKKYVGKTSLKRHILKAHLGKVETESVVCTYCGKQLSNKLNLKSHIEFMHEALFVSCPICKKKINFRTIGKHYKTHQTNPEFVDTKNFFLCNLCGKILKSKRGLDDHQKLHKNIRDQLCDICGSGFTTKKFLQLHKKTHEGSQRKMFECPQCDKVFSGRHTLNRHLLTHSGEKNFICEICSKCFYTLQELNRHVRCHKKEYRFDCQLCDMRFLDKSRFRHHMMRHRNIRPHKCQFCDKMFIVRGKMKMHMAAKHNVEMQSTKAVWKDPKTYIPLDDLL